jgi:5-methylcytosine-specific restriction endonuclease McrA
MNATRGATVRGATGGGATVRGATGGFNRMLSSGNNFSQNSQETNRIKRAVGETKKKFVASRQDWNCAKCNTKLSAWFEVDHIQRLDRGGSNHVDNLEALCRECHGAKTAMEKME